ncbi:uncharacterized protein LOC130767716 isoform X2 [Actinidia eriantha]|uniref:uncharacterized protein LOC130767716 isoform X2 n=1 Tax=Actinidia eriantha TaxID=165200 RepID=UPI0025828BB9|nr:uncharacterized protein LOC130767716 isoform X2 [Actinidia eriantha]
MVSSLCRVASGQSTFRFPGIIEKDAPLGSGLSAHRAIRSLSSTGGQNTFLVAQESHGMKVSMKLWIKSFTVLEFFVEIPETATGKKIIDEKKIPSETGISHASRLDVILEPKLSQDLGHSCPPSCPLQLPCDIPPLIRYSPAVAVVHQGTYDTSTDPLFCNLDDEVREDHEVAEVD